MTPGDRQLVATFLNAVSDHRPAPGSTYQRDVLLACAYVTSHGCDETAISDCARLLNCAPAPQPPGHCCLSCGATTDLDTVHVPAREGIAARVEFYCHSRTVCYRNRHPLGAVS